jgi:Ca2+-binding RTX toxin-like protein
MLRKLLPWIDHRRNSSKTKRSLGRRRTDSLGNTFLGVESLESRNLLNAAPVLSIAENQFFGAELSHVPFQATFTDVKEAAIQSFDYTIDWGDGSPIFNGHTDDFITQFPPNRGPLPGDPIVGRILEFHQYPDVSEPQQFPVTVTLTDGLGGSHQLSKFVDVYPVDPGLSIDLGSANLTSEGDEFSLNLPAAPVGSTWRINWGDVIQTGVAADSSAEHVYADDFDITEPNAAHTISAALVIPSVGTFYAETPTAVIVQDVPRSLSISGNAVVNEGDSYTLNILSSDQGADPIVFWIVYWQNTQDTESNPELVPDIVGAEEFLTDLPSTAPKVYAEPGSFLVRLDAVDDDGLGVISNLLSVTVLNVDPTADAGGPYVVTDETPFLLQGTGTDPGGPNESLEFAWDLDGDAIFGETGADALRGNEDVEDPLFDPTGIVGTVNVTLRVVDGQGAVGEDIAQITMQAADGVFLVDGTLSVLDSNAADEFVTVSLSGGNISVNSNGNTTVFSAGDVDEIEVVLGSGDDIVVITSNITVPVTIEGGAGDDILVGGGGRSVLIGGEGNDILSGSLLASAADVLLGGDGDDILAGFGGNDVLVGGNGNDSILGGGGRDVLIGSYNQDLLVGNDGEDILIGGYTTHDNDIDALDAIMAIWGSNATFDARKAALTGTNGLLEAGVGVFDDDAADTIIGGGGRDLVFGDNSVLGDGVRDSLLLILDDLVPLT